MFDAIVGQNIITELLSNEITNSSLPNSILFHGHNGVGKLSTALELVRVLNCTEDGRDDCRCSSCYRNRTLDFEGLIFLSRRDFLPLLNEYCSCYSRTKEPVYRERIAYTIKQILMPLQDFLIEKVYSESDKNTIYDGSGRIQELLEKEQMSSVDLEKLQKACRDITSLYKNQNIPVNMIRNMLDWTYIAHSRIKKVVIIDHAHRLEDSSANILLKRLEEPSANLYFILLANNAQSLLDTIRSRCRSYYFPDLSKSEVDTIVDSRFCHEGRYDSVHDFLTRDEETSRVNMQPVVTKLVNTVFLKEHSFSDLLLFIQNDKQKLSEKKYVLELFHRLSGIFEEEWLRRESGKQYDSEIHALGRISDINLKYIIDLVQEKQKKIDIFNANPYLQVEGLFYPLKVMVLNDNI